MNHCDFYKSSRQAYFFVEALVAMMIVSVVLGGTLVALTTASSISQGNKRQLTALILCEELVETLRQQWFASPDPITQFINYVDPDEQLPEPLNGLGWRDTSSKDRCRCPWPAALQRQYSGQYKIEPLLPLPGENGVIKRVQPGTLFQLQVRVQSANQDETVSLFTFLPLSGVPVEN